MLATFYNHAIIVSGSFINTIISCHSNEDTAITAVEKRGIDTLPINETHEPAILFNNYKPFQVLEVMNGVTASSFASDTNMCKGWTLTIKQATQVIKDAELISGTIWHYHFLVLPCIVKGQIRQEDKVYKYEINGGSWISITSTDTTLYYGSYIKSNEKYFLEKADVHE